MLRHLARAAPSYGETIIATRAPFHRNVDSYPPSSCTRSAGVSRSSVTVPGTIRANVAPNASRGTVTREGGGDGGGTAVVAAVVGPTCVAGAVPAGPNGRPTTSASTTAAPAPAPSTVAARPARRRRRSP